MEVDKTDTAAMIAGMNDDAHKEEQKIIQDAETQAAEKKKYAQQKMESILNEAQQNAAQQAEAIKGRALSAVEMEIKRRNLQVRDTLIRDIMNQAEKALQAKIDTPDYRSVLINWIVEAAMGLDTACAHVNASARERDLMNEPLFSEAQDTYHTRTGKTVTLTLSEAPPLESQGIILTIPEGYMAFNNQVKLRMARRQRRILTMIYDALFTPEYKES